MFGGGAAVSARPDNTWAFYEIIFGTWTVEEVTLLSLGADAWMSNDWSRRV